MRLSVIISFLAIAVFGSVTATDYTIQSCPLWASLSGRRRRDVPYGLVHTYIRIGSYCYDWGNFKYPRRVLCSSKLLASCVKRSTIEYQGFTTCSSRIREFERAWSATNAKYDALAWNCQMYSNALKDFLNNCYSNAADAVPEPPPKTNLDKYSRGFLGGR